MEGGDIFDCIDVNLQPAFNHPLLKDHKIQMEPSSFPIGMDVKSASPHHVSQAQPPLVSCPRGTIPILRNHLRHPISSKSIDKVLGNDKQQEAVGIKYRDNDIYGTWAIINVYEPKVKNDSKDLSATSIEIYNGSGPEEAIVAGYSVSPSLSGDSFARFHISWDDGLHKKSCYDHTCPGFVQVSHKFGLGARLQPVSVYNGPQYAITVLMFKDPRTKNWWVVYGEDNTPVGYWPSSLFTYIKDKGNTAFWGGHVSGPTASTDSPQIGSGHFASEGYGKSAFIKNIQIIDKNNKFFNPDDNKAFPGTSNSFKYTVDGYGVDKYGMHIYYGGPGDLV
ncbi:protein neprosin-like [Lolium perenne]|uniref:protein neprosin-like n=1 Tax=Lolium perenne TaxID=4522 RepID=UPI0021F57C9B|nr:uncharacterized protein LOC127309129 [Lolium perenne]